MSFFYKIGLLVGGQGLHEYALKFGLGKATGIDLPYEANGFIPSPLWRKLSRLRNWFSGDTANMAIGQGEVLVTPLQMARMTAVFANRGFLVRPYVVQKIAGRDVSLHQRRFTKLSLNEESLRYVREGLRAAVSDEQGTAHILAGLGVSAAGKTGTAQAPPGQPHAWCVAFFPFENPRFVLCVFLEHGGPGYAASVLVQQVIARMLQEKII